MHALTHMNNHVMYYHLIKMTYKEDRTSRVSAGKTFASDINIVQHMHTENIKISYRGGGAHMIIIIVIII